LSSYIENNLITDESITYQTNYHWVIYFSWSSLITLGIYAWIKKWTSEFAITTRRIVIKHGLIQRHTFEMNLSKIETVNVHQSVLGRMLNYGTVEIVGTGGTRETFSNISDPLEFRKKFQEQC
jgi:uncharacterized membrane protein YdbT with pleckstrin-like domain